MKTTIEEIECLNEAIEEKTMKTKKYDLTEYQDDDGFIIARVTEYNGKIITMDLIDTSLCYRSEYNDLRRFLDAIELKEWKLTGDDQP